jgi:hypothetical protein
MENNMSGLYTKDYALAPLGHLHILSVYQGKSLTNSVVFTKEELVKLVGIMQGYIQEDDALLIRKMKEYKNA